MVESSGQPPFKGRSFRGARRARLVRERVRAGHIYRYTYTYMYICIYTRRERRPERRTEREKCFAETENPNSKSARESRRSDSPTGAGSTPDFPRGRETTTRPPLLLPWRILACHRPPWENHFDAIPVADPGRTETPTPSRLRESLRSDSPTGAGGTPDFPRAGNHNTSPPFAPLGEFWRATGPRGRITST